MAAANIIEMALIMMIECKYREQTQRETGEADLRRKYENIESNNNIITAEGKARKIHV